jgi:hypothetical protein
VPNQPDSDPNGHDVPIFRNDHANDIVEMLRLRACPPEGEYLEHDHGHSDCYLEREAADEIERLRFRLVLLESETDDLRRDLPA